jgi:hypothetical protein
MIGVIFSVACIAAAVAVLLGLVAWQASELADLKRRVRRLEVREYRRDVSWSERN